MNVYLWAGGESWMGHLQTAQGHSAMEEPVLVGGVDEVVGRVLFDIAEVVVVVERERTIRTSIVGIGAVGSLRFPPWPIGSRTVRTLFVRDLRAVTGMPFLSLYKYISG